LWPFSIAATGVRRYPIASPGELEDQMKLIKAIVRPNKVEEVSDALQGLGISGLTVTEVRGHGKQKGHTAIYRGKEYTVNLLPKMEIDVVVDDASVEAAIKAIIQSARTGEIGDGRVFVMPVEQSFRIRTGELAV
jgi:nitrogen regulatory protein PII